MTIHVHGYRLQNEKYNTPFPYVWDVEQNNDRLTRPRYKSCFLLEALSEVDVYMKMGYSVLSCR